MGCIYTYSDPRNGEVRYVGKTDRTLEVRAIEHRYASRKGRTHLYTWMRSLPTSALIEVLEDSPADINEAEVFWITQLKAWGFRLVNHTEGGEGISGWHHSETTKRHLSTTLSGRAQPPGCAQNIRFAQKANVGSKKPKSKETIKIAMEASKSAEARIARSRALGGTAVLCESTGIVYQTVAEAARQLNLDPSSVRKAAKGLLHSTGGMKFKTLDPTPHQAK